MNQKVVNLVNKSNAATANSEADICAEAFIRLHHQRFRYDHGHQRWHEWDGSIWKPDATARAFHEAKMVCRTEFPDEVKASFVSGVAKLAAADPRIAVAPDFWDQDPFLLGTPGGTVDLRTGKLRPAIPSDYISKSAAVAPAPEINCPLWLRFLDEALQGDQDTIRSLQQWAGYSLTGDTREEALLFLFGPGGNGKSVFISTLQNILCGYSKTAPMETFTAGHNGFTSILGFDIATLAGARMVTAAETEEGRQWSEAKLKWLTGGDEVTARFVRQNHFSFRPQFKAIIAGNYKPVIKNVDDAMKRRLNIIGFLFKPSVPDRQLRQKLVEEYPGILRWMIEGCLDWQANGLVRSQAMIDATNEYFNEQDVIGNWLADRCEQGPKFADTSASLLASWHGWLLEAGEEADISDRALIQRLQMLGFRKIKDCQHHGTSIRGRGMAGLRMSLLPEAPSANGRHQTRL